MKNTTTKVVHISSNHIRLNHTRRNDDLPVFHIGEVEDGVWTGTEAKSIEIEGKVKLVYDRTNPLPIGARVWLEIEPGSEIKVEK